MAITAKHFPTHAGAHSDSHTELAVTTRARGPRRRVAAVPRTHRKGLQAVMVAHVSFPAVDSRARELVELVDRLVARRARVQRRRDLRRLEHGRRVRRRVRRGGACSSRSKRVATGAALQRAGRGPGVLDSLQGYVNPAAQLRLTRLHGRGGFDWESCMPRPTGRKPARSSRLSARGRQLTLEG